MIGPFKKQSETLGCRAYKKQSVQTLTLNEKRILVICGQWTGNRCGSVFGGHRMQEWCEALPKTRPAGKGGNVRGSLVAITTLVV